MFLLLVYFGGRADAVGVVLMVGGRSVNGLGFFGIVGLVPDVFGDLEILLHMYFLFFIMSPHA